MKERGNNFAPARDAQKLYKSVIAVLREAETVDRSEIGHRFQAKTAFLLWLVPPGDGLRPAFPERVTMDVTPGWRPPPPSETTNQAGTVNESRLFGNT